MRIILKPGLLALAVSLAACGGGGGDSTPAPVASTGSTPAGASATPSGTNTGTGTGTGNAASASGVTTVVPTTSIPASESVPTITVKTDLTNITNVVVDVDALAQIIATRIAPIPVLPPSPDATSPPPTDAGPVQTPIAQARFNFPRSVTMNGQGTLFVADTGNHTIRKITRTGIITTLAGMTGQSGLVDGVGAAARFSYVTSITVDDSDNLYVTDSNTVRKIDPAGQVTTVAGSSTAGYVDAQGTAARFNAPQGIFARGDGTLFVADTGNSAVRIITPTGSTATITTRIPYPRALVLGGASLYAADNFHVWTMTVSIAAIPSLIAGDPNLDAQSFANVDGPGFSARFWPIVGITLNPNGSLFAVSSMAFPKDSGGVGFVRRLTPVNRGLSWDVSTVAGAATAGYVDGPGSVARFKYPIGITTDITGNMFVADAGNQVLRIVTTDGVTSTYAGKAGDIGSNY